jgi:hypothetical protein
VNAGGWQRVTSTRRCPICGKPDWCLLARDGSAAICARVESPKRAGRNGAGWLHRLRVENGRRQRQYVRRVTLAIHRPGAGAAPVHRQDAGATPDFGQLAECYRAVVQPVALAEFAGELGVSGDSLRRLGVGWDGAAWTFPMRNTAGIVTGSGDDCRMGAS